MSELDNTTENTTDTMPVPTQRRNLLIGVLLGIVATVMTHTVMLGIFVSGVYIYAYYRHGKQVCYISIAAHLIVSILGYYILPKDNVDINYAVFESLSSISVLIFTLLLRAVGVLLFLRLSKYSWMIRIASLGITISIGAVFMSSFLRDFLLVFPDILRDNNITPADLGGLSVVEVVSYMKEIVFLAPVVAANISISVFLLNILLVFKILQKYRGIKHYTAYCNYLYNKIKQEYVKMPLLFLIALALGTILVRNAEVGTYLFTLYSILISICMVIIYIYIILGLIASYSFLDKMKITTNAYLLLVGVLLCLPVISIFVWLFLLISGIWFDIIQRTSHKQRGNV